MDASATSRRVEVYAALVPPVMNRATVVAKRAFESLNIIVEKVKKIERVETKGRALEEREKKKEKKRECSENENEK